MAVPLKPEAIPKELECVICLSIPLDPRILRGCSHVFCKDCIHDSLLHNHICPTCRCNCNPDQVLLLKDGSDIAHRIWCNIPVKCEHHGNGCTWTGAISDYKSHEKSCPGNRMIRKLHSLENENKRLTTENEEHKHSEKLLYAKLKMRCALENQSLYRENEKLKAEKEKLQKSLNISKEKSRKEIGSLKRKNGNLQRENRKMKREKKGLLNDMKTMAGIKRSLSAHANDEEIVN